MGDFPHADSFPGPQISPPKALAQCWPMGGVGNWRNEGDSWMVSKNPLGSSNCYSNAHKPRVP